MNHTLAAIRGLLLINFDDYNLTSMKDGTEKKKGRMTSGDKYILMNQDQLQYHVCRYHLTVSSFPFYSVHFFFEIYTLRCNNVPHYNKVSDLYYYYSYYYSHLCYIILTLNCSWFFFLRRWSSEFSFFYGDGCLI